MDFFRSKNSGFAAISALAAGTVGVLALLYFGSSIVSSSKVGVPIRETLIANALAEELLEFFLSQSAVRLRAYLSTNPANPALGAYTLCAPINLLDRSTGLTINKDPLAELPPTELLSANRFYHIEIIDLSDPNNLTKRRDLCGTSPAALVLTPSEKILVTVGVTWQIGGKQDFGRAVLSGVLPTELTL